MLEYWIQNGETVIEGPITKELIKNALASIFQYDGRNTVLSWAYFKQLNNASNIDTLSDYIYSTIEKKEENIKKICSFCNKTGAFELKGWVFPFIIAKDKFPNLYANGKIDINICKRCAYTSILAFKRVMFSSQKVGNYLCYIMFFADTKDKLKQFYNSLQESIQPNYYSNLSESLIDSVYYPYELVAALLYNIAIKVEDYESYRLGAIIIGLSTGSKKIYDTVDIVNDLNPIIKAFKKLYNENDKAFRLFFKGLRKDGNIDPEVSIKRNLFFRDLFKVRSINWRVLEDILFDKISENRTIAFIYPFLDTTMGVLKMSEKELFDKVSNTGYQLGKELLLNENNRKERIKPLLYELRRKRKMEEFLDAINLLQIKVEKEFYDKPFKDNPEKFPILKTFFLIGMTNAIFSRGESNSAG